MCAARECLQCSKAQLSVKADTFEKRYEDKKSQVADLRSQVKELYVPILHYIHSS